MSSLVAYVPVRSKSSYYAYRSGNELSRRIRSCGVSVVPISFESEYPNIPPYSTSEKYNN